MTDVVTKRSSVCLASASRCQVPGGIINGAPAKGRGMDKEREPHLPQKSLSMRGGSCPLNESAVRLLGTVHNAKVHMGSRTLGGGGRERAVRHTEWNENSHLNSSLDSFARSEH